MCCGDHNQVPTIRGAYDEPEEYDSGLIRPDAIHQVGAPDLEYGVGFSLRCAFLESVLPRVQHWRLPQRPVGHAGHRRLPQRLPPGGEVQDW